jgi:hypothetical protein
MSSAQAGNVTMAEGYWLTTIGTKNVIEGAAPIVLEALDRMQLDPGVPFCFSDIGCADGGSSLTLVRDCIANVRKRSAEQQINVVYTDQPRNNYNALFEILHGLAEGPAPSYLEDIDGVFACAAGTSFYRQMVPDNSLNLGFSSTAMHWLSRKPCDISDHVQAIGASGKELAEFQRQAHADWRTILMHRARELRPGGALMLVNFCRDEAGHYLGNTEGVHMFNTFDTLWRSMVDAGDISAEEYLGMTLPQYYNDVDEFSAPLTDTSSPIHQAGLRLASIHTRVVECPFKTAFKEHGDAERFARSYVPTLRSWTESTFFGALDSKRPVQERRELIDEYYDRYRQQVHASPEGHGMDYVHAYMVINKES